MTRTQKERQAYAMRRLALATNRAVVAFDDAERARAKHWARAWHACAYARLDVLVWMNSNNLVDNQT